ncbi:S41 family peptidase [Nitrosomonas sp.]|uniref:S41 family peptidase n=1 Tax=Nitrosomonas sp. TaxID=42353 RepID=UPI001DB2107B|nr:S41 family peptidase [Nitrosomonas sp.]MCB1947946.1 S41 family peptidase [Nitrosomonas sp.]MCP5242979.1 S41 family peptidase [Burkholderiales bacterium]MCP5291705.1 S41 family peptidase [Burkholderiales bacterium]MDR4514477.1 S41 family peptidase [Nitrosomonas sp.]
MSNIVKKAGLVFVGAITGVMLSLNFSAIAKRDSTEIMHPLPIEELRTFAQVFGRIKSDYVESVEDKRLITEAINGMLVGLDPHSSYLDKDEYKELQIGTHGEFGGLGIQVTMEDGLVKVISPIEDTPAFHAGIQTGDLIVKLDDTAVKGMSLTEAIKLMRGKPKTAIKITVVREGEKEPLVFNIIRDIIKIQSVKSKLLEPGYAYIRITQFQEHTGENLAKAIKTLFSESTIPMQGLILDLRNDPGGLLNGAVAVSSAFLPENALVVYTEGRTADAKMRLHANPEYYLRGHGRDYLQDLPNDVKTVPMITLVNGGSASASEIVAGALQDHKRSIVMGSQTFGKGSVQTVLPLGNDTAIKLTTALYYTPNGHSIQATGITPDILDESAEDDQRLREADLSRHISNGQKGEKKSPVEKTAEESVNKPKKDSNKTSGPIEFGSEDDLLLTQAMNYFKGITTSPEKKTDSAGG